MRSANEIAGMVLKAARGAGLPLGACEELGRAAPHLATEGQMTLVLDCLSAQADAPVYESGAFRGGHPLLVSISALDMRNAGVEARIACAVPRPLLSALQTARSGEGAIGPMEVDEALWQSLARLAEKTFVPETDASRRAGAGAGLTDND